MLRRSCRYPHSPCSKFSKEGERSEEHTSELQSQSNLVCRLLLEKKKEPKKCHSRPGSRKRFSNQISGPAHILRSWAQSVDPLKPASAWAPLQYLPVVVKVYGMAH